MSDPERPGDAAADAAGLVVASAPGSVGVVRRFGVDTCVALGWGDSADTVALLVTEVTTNAVLHASGPEIRVRVVDQGMRLRVEVGDGSPVLPVLRRAKGSREPTLLTGAHRGCEAPHSTGATAALQVSELFACS